MTLLQTNKEIAAYCDSVDAPWITLDTEFLRDKTYYSKLCLVQICTPDGEPVAIDPLIKGFDPAPLIKLLANNAITKVMHSCKQDMEIFYEMMADNAETKLPAPIFDTQVAAAVLGYGEQTSYAVLVKKICGEMLDKSRQFTDWGKRPLSDAQLTYALSDVTYLRDVYKHLQKELTKKDRAGWIAEDMNILLNPNTYRQDPMNAWRRIKLRSNKVEDYAALQALAAWREETAQDRNIPRNRVIRDEVLAQLAMVRPKDEKGLSRIRSLPDGYMSGDRATMLLGLIRDSKDLIDEVVVPQRNKPQGDHSEAVDMLKLLLKRNANEHGIASKMICLMSELEGFAAGEREGVSFTKGWRYEIFGKDAQAMLEGKIGFTLNNGKIKLLT